MLLEICEYLLSLTIPPCDTLNYDDYVIDLTPSRLTDMFIPNV
jgi:hypothetical protein